MNLPRTLVWAGLSFLPLVCGCSKAPPAPGGRPAAIRVVATIFPLADVARQIGGADVEVACLLGPGREPHGFTLKPAQAEQLSRADLVVAVGQGLDDWCRLPARPGAPAMLTLATLPKVRRLMPHPPEDPEHDHDEHGHGAGDPHIWLDPVLMRAVAGLIAEELARVDPAHRTAYRKRHEVYDAQLAALDREHRQALGALPRREFVTFHPAFGHLARRYGLVQRSAHAVGTGEPGPRRLEALAAFIRDRGVRVIFVEPQFPAERLRRLADRAGARIDRLDPLGNPNVKGYDGYLAMMRSNLAALRRGLGP